MICDVDEELLFAGEQANYAEEHFNKKNPRSVKFRAGKGEFGIISGLDPLFFCVEKTVNDRENQ
jgi:hypothetical protein